MYEKPSTHAPMPIAPHADAIDALIVETLYTRAYAHSTTQRPALTTAGRPLYTRAYAHSTTRRHILL